MKGGKYVPLLHCVTVDCFAAPCFVVEDKMDYMRKWEVLVGIYAMVLL